MKKLFLVLIAPLTLLSLLVACSATQPKTTTRWYTPEQVAVGMPLYVKYCADCHGERGQGAPNSDAPLPGGSYPPQPLNGSGHSWHHSLSDLQETVAKGGQHPGATMPGFGNVLNSDERKAVVAAFQSFWSDRTYRAWIRRGGLD